MSAADERHERQQRAVLEKRRGAVVSAVDQLVYDLGCESEDLRGQVDRLRSECARLVAERDDWKRRATERQQVQQQQPATPAKESP